MFLQGCLHSIEFPLKIIIPEEGDIGSTEFLERVALYHEPRSPSFELCCGPADALDVLLAGGGGEVEDGFKFFLGGREEHRLLVIPYLLGSFQNCAPIGNFGPNLEF